MYTDTISKQSFLIGIYNAPKEDTDSEGDNILDWTEEVDSSIETLAEEEEEEVIEKYYILLQLKEKELGYYDEKEEWISVYTLKDSKMSIEDLESISSLFKTTHNIRIFVSNDFVDEYNNLSVITKINNSSGLYMNDANPQDIRQGNGDKIDIKFIYNFEDVTDSEGKILFSKENREKMIKNLTSYYSQNSTALVNDIGVIVDLANNEDYNNLLPWTETIDPDRDTDNKYDDEQPKEEEKEEEEKT